MNFFLSGTINKFAVEFFGTLLLMYIILVTGQPLAIGAALALAALLGGPISGGSFNPAVTLALYFAGKMEKSAVLPYILVECLGALAAVIILRL